MEDERGLVIGVVGGSGGIGATSFAAVLAATGEASTIIDLDVAGGGIDVVLGIESAAGARWSGLHLAGGQLDPADLMAGLPRWGPCGVLAADVPQLQPEGVRQLVCAAVRLGLVVLDLPRAPLPERAIAVPCCDAVVLLARGDVSGLVAARALADTLPDGPVGLLVRRGELPAGTAAELIGVPLLGELPAATGGLGELDPRRLPRGLARVAASVLAGLAVVPGRHAALSV